MRAIRTKYQWFVEPIGSSTNKTVSEHLGDDAWQVQVLCSDGKRHNVWQCSYFRIIELKKSREGLDLNFLVWRQRGNGKISPWPPKKKPRRRAA